MLHRANARVHLVHLRGESVAKPRLITSASGVYRVGDVVLVELAHRSAWREGRVDDRPTSEAGGVIMVTLAG